MEREPLCHPISPGEEPAKGLEDIGKLCKINLKAESSKLKVERILL
jgi:hypothetical protein